LRKGNKRGGKKGDEKGRGENRSLSTTLYFLSPFAKKGKENSIKRKAVGYLHFCQSSGGGKGKKEKREKKKLEKKEEVKGMGVALVPY